jgi:addiction module RelB/DinJ family antitoxin
MKTLISIKTDVEVKQGIQRIAEELGIPLSTIINAYFKRLLRERRVDFVLPLQPNKKTARLLRQAYEDYKKGKNISPVFETAEEMNAYLDS